MREALHRWKKIGLEGLWERQGREGKPKWAEVDMIFVFLEKEPRTYNSVQIAQKLEQER
ncbi:transposase [Nostoc sphaeroides CCNUC1]|uniref:Transposase (Plasmid) n=1 Tax=Nostoc sphaeroides CCNUC1 TaxID=2653204 RepID=A0A5P8WC06_9NOSO|nr:transposase [Nostoc sphaeroides CCNUC1]